MRTGRQAGRLKISASERETLEAHARGHDRRLAPRAAAILASADGLSNKEIAARCGMTKQTVGKWRARFRARGLEGLRDEPRPGAPRRITDEQVARVLSLAAEPAPGGAAWTTRSMAQAMGLTQTAVSRIWRTHGVKPVAAATAERREGPPAPAAAKAPDAPRPAADEEEEGPARARTLAAIHALLRDAHTLRESSSPELDPFLELAIDAIEGALDRQREPIRSSYARAETALRHARNLLDQAEAALKAERSLAGRDAAALTAMEAMRMVADDLRGRTGGPAQPRRHR